MKTIRRPIFLLIAFLCAANLFAQNAAPAAVAPAGSINVLVTATNALIFKDAATVPNAATNPVPLGAGWVARHEGFVAQAKQGGIDILFMGDSITDFWRNRGSNVWNQYYAPRHAANFGISGDRTQHVLWRMDNGELDGIKPKVVVLMIGTNNTGKERDNKTTRNTVPETIAGVQAVVADIRARLPDSKILLLGIPAFRSGRPKVAATPRRHGVIATPPSHFSGSGIIAATTGDEGVACTFLRRGVAATLRPASEFGYNRRERPAAWRDW
jgi:uncharacterized Zn-binding protein involved in type VI secretion